MANFLRAFVIFITFVLSNGIKNQSQMRPVENDHLSNGRLIKLDHFTMRGSFT